MMNLRLILFTLALLAVLSASVGGYLYYSSLKEAAFNDAERQATTHVEMITNHLSGYLSENVKPTRTLAGLKPLQVALIRPGNDSLKEANAVLDHFKSTLNVDVCYLMDATGKTIASSNRDDPDSFVGKNFMFRPYFKRAIRGFPAAYLALGTTSNKRGAYHSHPIYGPDPNRPVGTVVVKVSIEQIENTLGPESDDIVLITDPFGGNFHFESQGLALPFPASSVG
jgi:C4-dicarboxylate-specific signal transduction histidine kinase